MNGPGIIFLLLNALVLLVLPRRWAPLPLLIGACYMTLDQGIEIGPFRFTIIRVLALAGFIRVLLRQERPAGGLLRLDGVLLVWAGWALVSGLFHKEVQAALIFRLGLVYNVLGIYFLIRCFCQTRADVVHLLQLIAILLMPVALEMVGELLTGHNLFGVLGGGAEGVIVRGDRPRARGPFAHPILAGTVGAICLPLMVGLWRQHSRIAGFGGLACLLMVGASNSSGPLMAVLTSGVALVFWRWRHLTRQLRIAAVAGYLLLALVMKAPVYYLIARINLTGSSTGWHRARLIESSLQHLREWWWAGTDYTRHWMPTGVSWSPDHADITNYYIKMGVLGGLPLMLLLIAALIVGFGYAGRVWRELELRGADGEDPFLIWSVGCALFSFAVSAISISYFDQSYLFVYLVLAILATLQASTQLSKAGAAAALDAGEQSPFASLNVGPAGSG